MARAPVSGRCKTRLIPLLGRRGAARLHEGLTRKMLRKAACAGTPIIAGAPDIRHRFFIALRRSGWRVQRQRGRDLGQRMRAAMRDALREFPTVIVVGTDCPGITTDDLKLLATAARGSGVACIPATDGGYVALAACQDTPGLFLRVKWGTKQVLQQTRRAARQSGYSLAELDSRADLDTPTDFIVQRRMGLLAGVFLPS